MTQAHKSFDVSQIAIRQREESSCIHLFRNCHTFLLYAAISDGKVLVILIVLR